MTPDWMAEALCAGCDPDLWYADRGESTREAKAICRACPVRIECLEYALDRNDRFGIWGGYSEKERRRIRASRRRIGQVAS